MNFKLRVWVGKEPSQQKRLRRNSQRVDRKSGECSVRKIDAGNVSRKSD